MKKIIVPGLCIVALVLLLALSASLVSAGDPGPTEDEQSPSAGDDMVQNYIPIQGRLTDASGNPLDGDYTATFRLYDVLTGGSALCSDTNIITVVKGLFNSEIWGNCQDNITGQQLYLSIEVEGNGEMAPRQPIYAVPYAWSLRPKAIITGTISSDAILHIENWATSGRGLRAYAMSTTGANYGIVGASKSPSGVGGYFYNNGGGTGLLAESNTGTAIRAGGTGVITSTASSYLWISGNNLRPYHQADSTTIDMDTWGGARITRGATAGSKNVMLPIAIPGPLYGQNVTVTGLDVYFVGETGFDAITAILLRRQIHVCGGATCYASIKDDSADYSCEDGVHPNGCVQHWDLTTNNVISANSGILYLTIELSFNGATSWIDIGGARLTLGHD